MKLERRDAFWVFFPLLLMLSSAFWLFYMSEEFEDNAEFQLIAQFPTTFLYLTITFYGYAFSGDHESAMLVAFVFASGWFIPGVWVLFRGHPIWLLSRRGLRAALSNLLVCHINIVTPLAYFAYLYDPGETSKAKWTEWLG